MLRWNQKRLLNIQKNSSRFARRSLLGVLNKIACNYFCNLLQTFLNIFDIVHWSSYTELYKAAPALLPPVQFLSCPYNDVFPWASDSIHFLRAHIGTNPELCKVRRNAIHNMGQDDGSFSALVFLRVYFTFQVFRFLPYVSFLLTVDFV